MYYPACTGISLILFHLLYQACIGITWTSNEGFFLKDMLPVSGDLYLNRFVQFQNMISGHTSTLVQTQTRTWKLTKIIFLTLLLWKILQKNQLLNDNLLLNMTKMAWWKEKKMTQNENWLPCKLRTEHRNQGFYLVFKTSDSGSGEKKIKSLRSWLQTSYSMLSHRQRAEPL